MVRIKVGQRLPGLTALAVCLLAGAAEAGESQRPSYHVLDAAAGIRRYVPGRWGMVGVGVLNPGERPVEVLSSMSFQGRPDLQYARVFWVPARARRMSWQPVLTPPAVPLDATRLTTRCLLTDLSDGSLIKSPVGQIFHEGMLPLTQQRPVTGVISEGDGLEEGDAIAAARMSAQMEPLVPEVGSSTLPPSMELLEGLDQLVLCSNRLASDPAGWTAVRRWLHGGGRLWIMLDRVDPATLSVLLGDRFRCEVVDRVGLTRVSIRRFPPAEDRSPPPERSFEKPVEMVRVVAGGGVLVTHTVNGWPAAMWLAAGEGRVLLTTVGAPAWTRPRSGGDSEPGGLTQASPGVGAAAPDGTPMWIGRPPPADDFATRHPMYANFPVATGALKELAAEFLQRRDPPALEPEKLGPFVSEQIGYQIVRRSTVVWVLGGFCVALAASGLWLRRRGKLERLAWIGPGLAVLAASWLAAAGHATRTSVPDSVAVAQLVDVDSAVNEVRVSGLAASYRQAPATSPLGAERGGIVALDMDGLGGTTRRMVWTDLDRWHWENLALPAGIRTGSLSWATSLADRPVRARATFGPEGLIGVLESGPLEDLQDAVLVAGTGRSLALRVERDGRFAAAPGDVLPAGQLAAATLVNDRQRWMQSLARELLGNPAVRQRYRAEPTILAWASPLEMGFRFGESAERLGGALVAIPLALQRPGSRTGVVIPSPLLPFRCVPWPGEPAPAVAYDYREGAWLGPLTSGSRIMLRFQCPAQLLPLRPTRAGVALTLSAPSRQVEIVGVSGGNTVSLARLNSPVGTSRVAIDRADVLELDPDGGLRVGVFVGEIEGSTSSEASRLGWKIEEVELEISGETLGPH
jgi:hypothetical protein